jgi:predicted AAA+ superfamily ATPase
MIETHFYIPRPFYLRKIRPFMQTPVIKVLVGQRRTGKSHILYQIMDEIAKNDKKTNIVYINTELAAFKSLRNDDDLYGYITSKFNKTSHNYVFIDEIQEITHWEAVLKSLLAEEKWDIYCSGSNAHLLSGELATFLAGRYIQFQIHPLSYGEFLDFYRLENNSKALTHYLTTGGMPYLSGLWREGGRREDREAFERRFDDMAFEYLHNLYESILLRDVVAREKIRNINFLENLTAYIADNTGNLFSASSISKYLKNQKVNINVQTILNYLSALERSYLISGARQQDITGLKIFEIGQKYYFEDLGLRNILVRNPAFDIPRLIEQAVYLHLKEQDYSVTVGRLEKQEIDFVARRKGEKIYVQVVYHITDEAVYRREFGNLELIPDQFPKYVVSMDEKMPRINGKGIRWMNLGSFLS